MSRVRQFMLLSVCVAMAGCASKHDWSIRAGPVEVSSQAAGKTMISGSFTVIGTSRATGSQVRRFGGACLVAHLADQGDGKASCRADADCRVGLERLDGRAGEAWGYCLGEGERSCWIKPDDRYCRNSKTMATNAGPVALAPGRYELGPVDADPLDAGQPLRWRVHACLAKAHSPAACGSESQPTDRQVDDGPPAWVSPRP